MSTRVLAIKPNPYQTIAHMSTSVAPAAQAPTYEIIIQPSKGWLDIPWREVWEYRDLLSILVRRDFLAKYKQTVLGPLWFILQPLLTTLVFTLVFATGLKIETAGAPPVLFYLAGLLPWGYFSQNVVTGSTTFTSNSHLFGKVYFPRLIVPLATVVSNLFAFLLQFGTFVLIALWFVIQGEHGIAITWAWLLQIPLTIMVGLFSLGLGLLFSASTAKYRDLSHLTPVLLQLWMFATPVIYPMSKLTGTAGAESTWAWLAWANPMAPVVEAYRYSLLGSGQWNWGMLGISLGVTIIVVVAGIISFNRAERTVIDSV